MAFPKLLCLPAEIRGLIFEYAVTADQKTVVTFRLHQYQRDAYSPATQPPVTRVSRQIRSESLPIYYECNDFVLHTEPPKLEDARRWLRCNGAYLADLRRISLWIRYVPFTDRAPSQGLIRVSLSRPRKHDGWEVDGDWKWVTVVRKPTELSGDADFILGKLRETGMISEISKETASPDDYYAIMTDLRLLYIQGKMS